MMLNKEIIKKIEDKFKSEIKYPGQCDALAQAIFDETKITIGVTTLKRLFGFAADERRPHVSTLDVIARYIDYPSFKLLVKDLGEDCDISMYQPVESLDNKGLTVGTQVEITYDPQRLVLMTYIGDDRFVVNESKNSKLEKGDILEIVQMIVGTPFFCKEVVRDNKSLGNYLGAKQNGLTSIEIIN